MKIQKNVKSLNLMNVDINWIGVFFSSCRCLSELNKFCREYHLEHYLLHQRYFVFVSHILASFEFLISTPARMINIWLIIYIIHIYTYIYTYIHIYIYIYIYNIYIYIYIYIYIHIYIFQLFCSLNVKWNS